jgi:hypothetical protein
VSKVKGGVANVRKKDRLMDILLNFFFGGEEEGKGWVEAIRDPQGSQPRGKRQLMREMRGDLMSSLVLIGVDEIKGASRLSRVGHPTR